MSELAKPCPILQLTSEEIQGFQYTPPEEITSFLTDFGYGPTKKLIDAYYLSPDKSVGVGVLQVKEETCLDHFGILRGVDTIESIAQAYVLYLYKTGIVSIGRPLFAGIENAEFGKIATPGAILNTVVQRTKSPEGEFSAHGWVLRSRTLITEADISGVIAGGNNMESLKKRAASLQTREQPIFPLKR